MSTADENNQQKLIDFIAKLQLIRDKSLADNSIQQLELAFEKKLETHKHNILLSLMGFAEGSWNCDKFKVDHCNGRSGESVLGDRIRTAASNALDNFILASNNSSFLYEVLQQNKAKFEQDIIKEFNSQLNYALKKRIADEADKLAKQTVDNLLKAAEAESKDILTFIKTVIGN